MCGTRLLCPVLVPPVIPTPLASRELCFLNGRMTSLVIISSFLDHPGYFSALTASGHVEHAVAKLLG